MFYKEAPESFRADSNFVIFSEFDCSESRLLITIIDWATNTG